MAKIIQGNPYEGLANAIIVQACDDYRAAMKALKKNPHSTTARSEMESIERFFHSHWYGVLTSVDGDFLIRRLREEMEE